MSPLKVLTRGYSLTSTDDGKLIRSIKGVKEGDRIKVSLSDGSLQANVIEIAGDNYE
jgi:exodeoxyribonuclease VII large subunit